jgi:hypothetical protein
MVCLHLPFWRIDADKWSEEESIPLLTINQALSDAYLKSEGLYALRDGWIKLHYPE